MLALLLLCFICYLQTTFGSFKKDSPVVTATTTPQQEHSPPPMIGGVGSSGGMSCPPSSMTSSPVSMPSSFEGDLFPTAPTCLPPMTMIQEYNLTQLATLATATASNTKDEPPSSNPSPTPSFNLVDLFQGDISSNALNNLQALAKLGTASINDQGKRKQINNPPQPRLFQNFPPSNQYTNSFYQFTSRWH